MKICNDKTIKKTKDDDAMSLERIATLLYNSIGLNSDSIGQQAILDAVNIRMDDCNINNIQDYYQIAASENTELKELIEEVVVPETWFFRDNKPFKQLIKFADEEWGAKTSNKPLRILSLPCASGEEPYSIAMTMLDAGFMPSQVEIDALDISKRNIRRCKEAEYRSHSFRGVAEEKRDRFFNKVGDKYQPDILVKSMVNFSQASILDPALLYSKQPYDVVFCRNLLIYFDSETQLKARRALNKLLTANGLLFLGHAETGIFLNSWYLSKKYPKAFIMRKFNDSGESKKETKLFNPSFNKIQNTLKSNKKTIKPKISGAASRSTQRNTSSIKKTLQTSNVPSLTDAQQLFNNKNFKDAESLCLTLLEDNKQNNKTHLLLGQINFETDNIDKAKKYFHNVIYLSPNNYDALMHLYRIELNNGNKSQAKRLFKRAERAQEKVSK